MLRAVRGNSVLRAGEPRACVPDETGVPDSTLPRSARLLKRREYQRVFERAVRSADAGFTVLAATGSRDDARLGLAVPKRQIRGAVQRNRVKRRIRESFRHRRRELAGLDVVVMAKAGVEAWTSAAVQASLARHWCNVRRRCAG